MQCEKQDKISFNNDKGILVQKKKILISAFAPAKPLSDTLSNY